jgi:hypothetical protein
MMKEIAESARMPSREFGRDLFSRDGQMPKDDNAAMFNSSKALLARKYFKDLLSSSEGKAKLYKDILSKGYANFFVNGFSLTEFNTQLEYLPKYEKALILKSVVEALNLDLTYYSSMQKKKVYNKVKQNEKKLL